MRTSPAVMAPALVLAVAFVAACSSSADQPPPRPADQPQTAAQPAGVVGTIQLWTEAEVDDVLRRLAEFDFDTTSSLLSYASGTKDRRMIAPFIQLLRFRGPGELYTRIDHALLNITGESFGPDWGAWMEWLGRQDDVPLPDGLARWKGETYGARIDPQFRRFIDGTQPTTLRVELIQWGGVRVDGIPALENPAFISPQQADYLVPDEPVFGVEINGDVRAYPLRILDWHEMANDVVGGVPVSLAYCTLCGAGVLYETETSEATFTFGSSGLLYGSNKLMYDRQTDTLWNQLTGEPVHGALAGSGIELRRRPIVVTSWADWLADHPQTRVLDIDTGHVRDYTPGAAYGDYFASSGTMFPTYQRSQALPEKAWIYALVIDGTPKAYPLELLQEQGVANDTLTGETVVLLATPGTRAVRVYERGDLEFAAAVGGEGGASDDAVVDGGGRVWTVTEDALLGPGGKSLARLPGHLAYWFGWFSFYPRTQLYGDS
ncbi:MAG: DUF3179 domain-containing (seleno)protein [Dehalococcoidia bacterium]|nr:DUF3179 domain-containing (seleno)protein [Dehalococcoidia bacterium]